MAFFTEEDRLAVLDLVNKYGVDGMQILIKAAILAKWNKSIVGNTIMREAMESVDECYNELLNIKALSGIDQDEFLK